MTTPSPPIQSRDNPVFKRLRSLQRTSVRDAERAFIVEGFRAVTDAVETGATPELVVLSADFDAARLPENAYAAFPVRLMDPRLFADLADTTTPQGVLAVFPFPTVAPGLAKPELRVIVDGLRDPGNLGTLLRTCAGAGVSSVHISRGGVDSFNPKVVRSAMGAHFRVPIVRGTDAPLETPGKSVQVVVADAEGSHPYDQIDMTGPTWLVIGSEADGVGAELREMAMSFVSIPMANQTESLNASVAASIIIFEALRQRRVLTPIGAILA